MADVLERAHRLGHEVFAPIAARGEPGRLNRPLVRALGEQGLLELVFAGSAVELCELREGLAHGCTEAETALALQGLGGYPILSRGRPRCETSGSRACRAARSWPPSRSASRRPARTPRTSRSAPSATATASA